MSSREQRDRELAQRLPGAEPAAGANRDTGERYFTTILFEGINEGTDEKPAA